MINGSASKKALDPVASVYKYCLVSVSNILTSTCQNEVSASLVMVHLIEKLAAGDTGSLSVSILQKMSTMSKKLKSHPAFSELLAQYSQSGYRYIEMISLEQFLTTFVVEAFRMEECISLILVYISCFVFSDKGI
ncbi:uncharacterized protein LOC133780565 [Humulus lupulus]|uniref:uncharacterized protein LOC133780565 n=1 Tax=Humulus lupulus TaxID=3486 RepID=UPI002B4123BB|nr:uncharacterized protein LOC133780565 [Humulus lupulus]